MGTKIRMPRLIVVGRSAVFEKTLQLLPEYWRRSATAAVAATAAAAGTTTTSTSRSEEGSEEPLLFPLRHKMSDHGSEKHPPDSEKGTVNVYENSLSNASVDSVVDFDGVDDPTDPFNWSPTYKWSLVTLISLLSLIV